MAKQELDACILKLKEECDTFKLELERLSGPVKEVMQKTFVVTEEAITRAFAVEVHCSCEAKDMLVSAYRTLLAVKGMRLSLHTIDD